MAPLKLKDICKSNNATDVITDIDLEVAHGPIRNVHLKDSAIIDGEMIWQRYGDGVTDVKGQVAALRAGGYQGTLVLEPACKPHNLEDVPTSVSYLRSLG